MRDDLPPDARTESGAALVRFAGWRSLARPSLKPPPWVLALLVVLVIMAAYRKVIPGVHGTSRWANDRDLAPLMATGRGLLVGRAFARPRLATAIRLLFRAPWRDSAGACRVFFAALRSRKAPGELVRLPDVVHTAMFAPTGVGKSTGLIIPHLLTCEDSSVVVDTKGELARATARHRRKVFKHKCVFLDPFQEFTKRPDCLNPLDFIERDDPGLIDACRVLIESMIIRTGNEKDPTWNDSAENVIRTICCYVAHYAPDNDRSLQTVQEPSSQTPRPRRHRARKHRAERASSTWPSTPCRTRPHSTVYSLVWENN